jgi:hypothetical protein
MRRVDAAAVLLVLIFVGCRSAGEPQRSSPPPWDLKRAEIVKWQSDHPAFSQEFALEASGLAASQELLFVTSEKYGRLLLVHPAESGRVVTVRLAVPQYTELEGVALGEDGLIFCDEAHAAVYLLAMDDEQALMESAGGERQPVFEFVLEGVGVRGGKIGFEGIEIDPDDGSVYILLERSGTEETGCVSRIWELERSNEILSSWADPIEVHLDDCTWRLTGLAWWNGELIALRTQFPGMRYEVVSIDLETGATVVLLDPTKLLRILSREGWSNNVEGIAIGADGSLWLVADNAVTGVISDPLPPLGEKRTLLLRIPPSKAVNR